MKKEDVPFVLDPDGFTENTTFPVSTQYMVYNPLLHRYYLTEAGLSRYNIDANRKYITDSPNKVQELIEKTSKKIYDYIQYKAGRKCYHIQMYRIAAAPKTIYPDQYFMRKQFEEVLADQARYLVESGDSARYSRASIDADGEAMPVRPEDAVRDTSDISPEAIRTLETLGLTRWFKVPQFTPLDYTKF